MATCSMLSSLASVAPRLHAARQESKGVDRVVVGTQVVLVGLVASQEGVAPETLAYGLLEVRGVEGDAHGMLPIRWIQPGVVQQHAFTPGEGEGGRHLPAIDLHQAQPHPTLTGERARDATEEGDQFLVQEVGLLRPGRTVQAEESVEASL